MADRRMRRRRSRTLPKDVQVITRLAPEVAKRLDGLCDRWGVSKTRMMNLTVAVLLEADEFMTAERKASRGE